MLRSVRFSGKRLNKTTDNLLDLSKYKDNSDVLILIHLIQKQWVLLNELNYSICQHPVEFVVKNKPILDKEKLILIQFDIFIKNMIKNGLKQEINKPKKDNVIFQFNFRQKLNETTFNAEWNFKSKEINKLTNIITSNCYKEHVIIDMTRYEKNSIPKSHKNMGNYKKHICFISTWVLLGLFVVINTAYNR
jgi:hypothetical protein